MQLSIHFAHIHQLVQCVYLVFDHNLTSFKIMLKSYKKCWTLSFYMLSLIESKLIIQQQNLSGTSEISLTIGSQLETKLKDNIISVIIIMLLSFEERYRMK